MLNVIERIEPFFDECDNMVNIVIQLANNQHDLKHIECAVLKEYKIMYEKEVEKYEEEVMSGFSDTQSTNESLSDGFNIMTKKSTLKNNNRK